MIATCPRTSSITAMGLFLKLWARFGRRLDCGTQSLGAPNGTLTLGTTRILVRYFGQLADWGLAFAGREGRTSHSEMDEHGETKGFGAQKA